MWPEWARLRHLHQQAAARLAQVGRGRDAAGVGARRGVGGFGEGHDHARLQADAVQFERAVERDLVRVSAAGGVGDAVDPGDAHGQHVQRWFGDGRGRGLCRLCRRCAAAGGGGGARAVRARGVHGRAAGARGHRVGRRGGERARQQQRCQQCGHSGYGPASLLGTRARQDSGSFAQNLLQPGTPPSRLRAPAGGPRRYRLWARKPDDVMEVALACPRCAHMCRHRAPLQRKLHVASRRDGRPLSPSESPPRSVRGPAGWRAGRAAARAG